jgi:hypothetical protein
VSFSLSILMVVDEFEVFRTFIRPYEANPPLVVHSDRVLPGSVTPEGLRTVARGRPQIVQVGRGVQVA